MDALDQEVAATEAHLARCDTKASLLLGLCGALAAVLVSAAVEHRPPLPAVIVGLPALLAIAVATGLLLAAVRPHIGGSDRASWPHWAQCTPQEIAQQLGDSTDRRPDRVAVLSRLTAAKYQRIRRACDALAIGLALLAAAGLLAAF